MAESSTAVSDTSFAGGESISFQSDPSVIESDHSVNESDHSVQSVGQLGGGHADGSKEDIALSISLDMAPGNNETDIIGYISPSENAGSIKTTNIIITTGIVGSNHVRIAPCPVSTTHVAITTGTVSATTSTTTSPASSPSIASNTPVEPVRRGRGRPRKNTMTTTKAKVAKRKGVKRKATKMIIKDEDTDTDEVTVKEEPIEGGRFDCPHCSKSFLENSARRRHVKLFHPGIDMPPRLRVGPKPRKPGVTEASVKCRSCEKTFFNKSAASRHEKMAHKVARIPKIKPLERMRVGRRGRIPKVRHHSSIIRFSETAAMSEPKHRCLSCNKAYQTNSALRWHVKQSHPGLEMPPCQRAGPKPKTQPGMEALIKCRNCDKTFFNKCALSRHETSAHREAKKRVARESRMLVFENLTEFLKWKTVEENATSSRYVKARKDKASVTGEVRRTYVCHRSGNYRPKGHGLRQVHGSVKIGSICPAAMFLRIHPNGRVNVAYCSQHNGHDSEVANLHMRKEQREQIAGMLAAGIPFEDVLDKIQLTAGNNKLPYVNLATSKDIPSVIRDYMIPDGDGLNTDDAESLAAWIEKTRQDDREKSIVRFVKYQGEESEHGLNNEDFMLVLISEAQIAGLQKFCGPMKEVALDSIHGTTDYDFQITTLLTIDEHGDGFPGALCYSNRVDECAMKLFLSVCKEAIGGPLYQTILMTDDTKVYSNAWQMVMGPPAHRLLCTWHVDKAWRKNLSKIKGDNLLKATVYKTLRSLMEIPDVETFSGRLQQFLQIAQEHTKTARFADYFSRNFANRPELWAYSHRAGLHVHHNMNLEALHRLLKLVHHKGWKARRMDKSIHSLMKLLRMKMNDRLLKMYKCRWTSHITGIKERHEKSLSLDPSIVICVHENMTYAVKGAHDEVYLVEQCIVLPHDNAICPQVCSECRICVHTFYCSCLDGGLQNTICKHVHLVMRACNPQITTGYAAFAQPNGTVLPPQQQQLASGFINSNSSGILRTVSGQCLGGDSTQNIFCEALCSPGRIAVVQTLNEATGLMENRPVVCADVDVPQTTPGRTPVDQHFNYLRSAAETNPDIAATICDQLSRLKNYVSALQNKTELPKLPIYPTLESMDNKVAIPRQIAPAPSRKPPAPKRPKIECTIARPEIRGDNFLLRTLDGGQVAVTMHQNLNLNQGLTQNLGQTLSQNLTEVEHYDIGATDFLNFEQCY